MHTTFERISLGSLSWEREWNMKWGEGKIEIEEEKRLDLTPKKHRFSNNISIKKNFLTCIILLQACHKKIFRGKLIVKFHFHSNLGEESWISRVNQVSELIEKLWEKHKPQTSMLGRSIVRIIITSTYKHAQTLLLQYHF